MAGDMPAPASTPVSSHSRSPGPATNEKTHSHNNNNLPTRAQLKRELLGSIPHGAELDIVAAEEARLQVLHGELLQAQARRTRLRREITVRERKLTDWKSKIPRVAGVPRGVHELRAALKGGAGMRCHAVACVGQSDGLTDGQTDGQMFTLAVGRQFAQGLVGLQGFEKAWIVAVVPSRDAVRDVMPWALCVRPASTDDDRDGDGDDTDRQTVILLAVDVVQCDVASGVVVVQACQPESEAARSDDDAGGAWRRAMGDAVVIDIKPYLGYCDAASATIGSASRAAACGGDDVAPEAQLGVLG